MSKQREVVRNAVKALCALVDTPRSLTVALLLDAGEDLELTRLSIDSLHYMERDVQKFKDDYLVTEILSKYKGLKTGIDLEQAALTSFFEGEETCAETNSRLTSNTPEWCAWQHVIQRAQEKIARTVGPRPSWLKLQNRFRWSNGATASIAGRRVRIDNKLREERISVTPEARKYLRAAMATDYAWLKSRGIGAPARNPLDPRDFEFSGPTSPTNGEFSVVRSNVVCLVDKNAKTKRTIAKEPTGNVFLQLGVGGYFRQCLKRVGIDLDDQANNQCLASMATLLDLATVDLKNASNTICREIVWLLFPEPWAQLLDDLRSSHSLMPDKSTKRLEMFSSMGNGFTFELESLIFWALSTSLAESLHVSSALVSVYGDDVIVPSQLAAPLKGLFQFCGFKFNDKKTHTNGLFFESCGKHYFNGVDVTPLYIKDMLPRSRPSLKKAVPGIRESELYALHNRILRHALVSGVWLPFSPESRHVVAADERILTIARYVRREAVREAAKARSGYPFYTPVPAPEEPDEGFRWRLDGDVYDGLWVSADDERLKLKRTPYGRAWYYTGIRMVSKKFTLDGSALLAVKLRTCAMGRDDVLPTYGEQSQARQGTATVTRRTLERRDRKSVV